MTSPAQSRVLERYLTELELALKRRPGVIPEDALADTFETLMAQLASLEKGPELPDDELLARLVAAVGSAAAVADGHEARAGKVTTRPGYAPGWRMFCRVCRRSGPAAQTGMIRIGAWSWGKRVLGFCRGCGKLRWLCVVKDLDRPNLTRELLANPGEALAARDRRRASFS